MRSSLLMLALLGGCEHKEPTAPNVGVASLDAGRSDAARSTPDATPAPDAVPADATWVPGDGTRLHASVLQHPKHDGPSGKTRLRLETLDGSQSTWQDDLAGIWTVLGYSSELHAYVLGGEFQVGGWLPLVALQYLDERSHELRKSRWNGQGWMAFAAVPSPTLRYLALVAQLEDGDDGFRLHVLDLVSEELAVAGRAPAPPPSDFDCDEPRALAWGDDVDGLFPMDAGIIEFSSDERQLIVSHGKDTCAARATRRNQVVHNLTRLRWTPPPTE